MYSYKYTKNLLKILQKLKNKNRKSFENVIAEIRKIRNDPTVGKPLTHRLKNFRRIHVNKSFVLVYQFRDDYIVFVDYDHHDNIYRKGQIFDDGDLITIDG